MSRKRPGSRFYAALDARRWARVRKAAFERDGHRCRSCGRAGRLEAHHEPPLRDGADPYDLSGIVTLCRECHIERHRNDRAHNPEREAWGAYVAELAG